MNKTSDGANSWQAVENPMFTTGKGINALRYWNSDTVYAGGASGNLMRSYDGGATWTAGTAGTGTFYDICPITGTKVVAVAASGKYYTSTDGVTFTNAGTFGSKNLSAVEFRDNVGIVVAAGGTIYRTTVDNWTNLTSVYTEPSSKDLYDIEFVDNTTVYVVGAGGIILKSEDAGLTWASQVSPTTENLRKLRFASPKLWAAGDYGTILMNPVGALAGEYYIPKGTHEKGFATLGAAISSLNSLGTQAAVKFLVDDNLNELGTELIITRNDLTAETGVTIKPATGKTPTITITGFPTTGNHSKQGFTIENASFITIDGSNTEGGTTKDLTITGNDATNGAYIVGVIDNSDNVTIKNVNITVTNMTAGGTILGVDGYTGAPDKLWIENCNIGAADKTLTNGVALWGNAATTPVEAVVKDCNIYATRRGITTFYNKENAYINNNIAIVTPRADQSFYCGIYLTGFGAGDTSVIFNNRITAIGVNTTASKFAAGIAVYGNEGVFDIFNNFIATNTINTGAATTCRVYGIVFGSATWSGTANIYHNTIDIAPTNQTGIHAAIGTEVKSSATLNIFNNILSNRHDAANSYGIHWTNAPSASSVLTLDYNDIYMAGATAKAGLYNATECATLDAWKTASGQDANSKAKITNFVSASDLHLTGASIGDNDLACYRINWLLTDIDGDSRPEVTYMGADEGSTPLTVGIATNTSDLPTEFSLEQNYPNPFNPTTTIAFSLPKSTKVTLAVYNILGQQVAVLQNGFLEAGYYRMNFNASNLPSGMYIYRITANGYSNVKKMAIMK
ncbi:MAG: YCF48-related protein [Candidatus Neomarinimicrobiota bacterium]